MSDQQELHEITITTSSTDEVDLKNLTCGLCKHWCGRCVNGKVNRTASDSACERFEERR